MAKRGFTLVELLAIIIIIGILATITTPVVLNVVKESKQNTFTSEYKMVTREIEKQMTEEGIKVLEDCNSSKRNLSSLNIRNSKKIDNDSSYFCYDTLEECNYLYLKTKDNEKGGCIDKQKNSDKINKVIVRAKTISGKNPSICNIENLTLTATVRPAKKNAYTYQWYQNGEAIKGATSQEYTTNITGSDSNSYEWYVIVTIKSNGNTMKSNIIQSTIALATITDTKPTLVSTINSITATQNQYSGTCAKEVYYRIKKESEEEYSNWQKENTFTNLKSGTAYQVQTKIDDKVSKEALIKTKDDLKATIEVTGSTTNSISVKAICTSSEAVSSYEFKIDNGELIHNKTNATYTFNGVKSGEHTVYVKCTSNNGQVAEATGKGSTKTIADIKFASSPATGWTTGKTVTITYPDTNITNPEYYFYSSVNATSNVEVTECAMAVATSCNTNKTTKIEANKWYKTTSKTPQIDFHEMGNIRAYVSDGTNSKQKEYAVPQIDSNEPSVKADVTPISTDKITVTARCSSLSGISEYKFKMDNGSWITSSTNTHTFTGLKPYNAYGQNTTTATHTFQVECKNGVGISKRSDLVNEKSKPYIPPIYGHNDSTDSTGKLVGTNWRTSKTYKVEFNGSTITTPTFYFYTSIDVDIKNNQTVLVYKCNSSEEAPKEKQNCASQYVSEITAKTWYIIPTSSIELVFKKPGQIVTRISDGTSYYQGSSQTVKEVTGVTINDYEIKGSLLAHLDGIEDDGGPYHWRSLSDETGMPRTISTTSGWQRDVCIAYSNYHGQMICNERIDNALYFDGVDDYLAFDFIKGKNEFTIETVYKPTDLSNTASQYHVISSVEGAGVVIGGNGFGSAYINTFGYEDDTTFTTPSTLNRINYRALSIKNGFSGYGTPTAFFNLYSGEDTTSDKFKSEHTYSSKAYKESEAPLVLGCNPADRSVSNVCRDGNFFKGYIFAVRIHDGALTDEQIAKNAYIDRMRYGF